MLSGKYCFREVKEHEHSKRNYFVAVIELNKNRFGWVKFLERIKIEPSLRILVQDVFIGAEHGF